jgi:hypothetical protein
MTEWIRPSLCAAVSPSLTALLHHVNVDTLGMAFYALKRKAAAGIDGVTWQDYETDLGRKLEDLHGRVHRGAYQPQPSRRTYIPKAGGRQRPLAIAALEDKIVQGACVMVLNAIYEEDFLGFLQSSSRSRLTKADVHRRQPEGVPVPKNPITGIAGCCARAVSGHEAANPPASVKNSRRRMPPSFGMTNGTVTLASGGCLQKHFSIVISITQKSTAQP